MTWSAARSGLDRKAGGLLATAGQEEMERGGQGVEVRERSGPWVLGELVACEFTEFPGSAVRRDPEIRRVIRAGDLLRGPHRGQALAPAAREVVPLRLDN